MTVEADLYNALKALVANRVYPDLAPLNTVRPFITYSQVGGEALARIGAGVSGLKNGRFQIDVYADSRMACAAVALQVEAAMLTATVFKARAIGAPISGYEPDVLVFSSMQDFSIFSPR